MNNNEVVLKKDSKNKIRVDYEGKLSLKDRIFSKVKTFNTYIKVVVNIFRFILMLGVSYVILQPFFARIANSFMSRGDILDPTVSLIPKAFNLEIYKAIIIENHYFEALWHTALLALVCALIQTMIACLVGYGLAKFKFKGNSIIMGLVVVTMIIPHEALFLAFKEHFTKFDILAVQSWGVPGPIELMFGSTVEITNTFLPLMLISLGGFAFKNGLYIYLMRQFFKGVPDELEESAYVDGSGVFRTFVQIIIPLSVPMMITIFLFSFSWQWTDEFYVNLFWSSGNGFYLMPDIYKSAPQSIVNQFQMAAGWTQYKNVIQNTAGILIISPLVLVYLFCQRYLVQGIERSGLVG